MAREPKKIVRGHTVVPRNPQGRREGFTTGTAAAAAAKAACLVLLDQGWPETVRVQLPIPRVLEIRINTLEWDGEAASASSPGAAWSCRSAARPSTRSRSV